MPFERDSQRSRRGRDGAPARRFRGDRGAILAEAALLSPFFITLIFGMLEFGGAFRDYLTLSTTTAAGARQGAIQGTNADANYQIIKSMAKASGAMPVSQIQDVKIWKATAADTGPPSTCDAAHFCDDYSGSALQTYLTEPTASESSNWFNCTLEPNWCPSTRVVIVTGPPDYIGVYMQINHQWLTGLFGKTKSMSNTTVSQLEPQKLGS
jgi:Flp pilus assembly protein TadG